MNFRKGLIFLAMVLSMGQVQAAGSYKLLEKSGSGDDISFIRIPLNSELKLREIYLYCFRGDAQALGRDLAALLQIKTRVLAADVIRYSGRGESCVGDTIGQGPGGSDGCDKLATENFQGYLESCDIKD